MGRCQEEGSAMTLKKEGHGHTWGPFCIEPDSSCIPELSYIPGVASVHLFPSPPRLGVSHTSFPDSTTVSHLSLLLPGSPVFQSCGEMHHLPDNPGCSLCIYHALYLACPFSPTLSHHSTPGTPSGPAIQEFPQPEPSWASVQVC